MEPALKVPIQEREKCLQVFLHFVNLGRKPSQEKMRPLAPLSITRDVQPSTKSLLKTRV
jgi:hypothetical protein